MIYYYLQIFILKITEANDAKCRKILDRYFIDRRTAAEKTHIDIPKTTLNFNYHKNLN